MAHGTPDYWGAAPKSTTYGSQDMAELAVRLGSPINFDRRGEAIDFTTFAHGWGNWSIIGSGAGATCFIGAQWAQYGNLHAWLKTGVAAGDYASIVKTLFYPVLGGLGFEIAFVPAVNLRSVSCTALLYTGATVTEFNTRYLHTTGKLQVWAGAGAWVEVGSPGIQLEGAGVYITLKTVFNSLTGKYMRVLFNGASYVSDPNTGVASASAVRKGLVVYVNAFTNAAAEVDVAVGHVAITQNEPS